MRKFSTVLKQLREERHMSQNDLSNVLKIAKSTVGMYESDKRKPSFEALENIADYFNVDIDYLYGKTLVRNSSKELEKDGNDLIIDGINLSKENIELLTTTLEELTEEQLQQVVDFVKFVHSQESKKNK